MKSITFFCLCLWAAYKNAGYLVSLSFRQTANNFLQSEYVPNLLSLFSQVKNHCLGLEPPICRDHTYWRLQRRAGVDKIRISCWTEQLAFVSL